MKYCARCKTLKNESDFNKNKRHNDGLSYTCRICANKADRDIRKKYPEKYIFTDLYRRCNDPKNNRYYCYGKLSIKCRITIEEIKNLMIRDGYDKMKWPTIDRKDKNKDYTYNNCQFIEHFENTGKDKRKPIIQYDLKGNFIKEWESQNEVERQLKIQQSNIWKVCVGERHTVGGFIFKYKES